MIDKKLVVTLDINYDSRITDITFPYMHQYAKNIDADFKIISSRIFDNSYPISLEKFQLYDISEKYDWVIFFDADLLVNPDCFDLTKVIDRDMILVPGSLNAFEQFEPLNILGKYSISHHYPLFLSVFSFDSRDAFKYSDINPLEFTKHIKSDNKMISNYKKNRDHDIKNTWFLDELIYSFNVHRYKIPFASIKESFPNMNIGAHPLSMTNDEKISFLLQSKKILDSNYD